MASGPARMPNERALTERMLGLLSEAGLPDSAVTLAYHALIEYVVGSAAIDTAGATDSAEDVEARHRTWRAAYFAAPPTEFPHTTRLAPRLYPSLDEQFEFGIDVLIAGLRQLIRRQQEAAAAAVSSALRAARMPVIVADPRSRACQPAG